MVMRLSAVLAAALLGGCETAAPPRSISLGEAFAPTYVPAAPGVAAPAACLSSRPSGYGPWPARCALDAAFGVQLARPEDVLRPRPPGPPSALPAGRAAEAYILGVPPAPPALPTPAPLALDGAGGSGSSGIELPPEPPTDLLPIEGQGIQEPGAPEP